jgi:predicted nucleic acid-binding protein
VTRFLLDTNIISNVMKPSPSDSLMAWLSDQIDQRLFIASLNVAEIYRGVLEKTAGARRKRLEQWFASTEGPQAKFGGHVLPFDEKSAMIWARLMEDGKVQGQPRSPLDTVIASIAVAHDCVVVTDNVKDFHGVKSMNPMR